MTLSIFRFTGSKILVIHTDVVKRSQAQMITDERNWVSGLHGGGRPIRQAAIERDRFAATQPQEEGQS